MLKLVVIEDEEPLLEELLLILEFEGYDVIGTSSGINGIELIKQHKPDLIISDIMMSSISGFEILQAVRDDPLTNHIPFIFLTAVAERSSMRQGMVMGADDYLTKPFGKDELLTAITVRIQKFQERKDRYRNGTRIDDDAAQ